MLALKLSPPVTDSRGFLPEIKHNSPRPWSHFVRNRHAQSRFRMMSSSSLNVVLVNKLETLQPQTLNLNTNFKKPKHKLQKRKLQALGVLALPRALDPETSIQDLLAVYFGWGETGPAGAPSRQRRARLVNLPACLAVSLNQGAFDPVTGRVCKRPQALRLTPAICVHHYLGTSRRVPPQYGRYYLSGQAPGWCRSRP